MRRATWRAVALASTAVLAAGCFFEQDPSDGEGGAASTSLGGLGTGAASLGGASGSGGASGAGAGGMTTGGSAIGGAATGGAATGGLTTGGTAAGGLATGGSATGGDETGGVETGGVETGGVETGGVETGGVETGGVETGGAETGGAETGGVEAGGVETGGVETGGVETGGAETGGVETGGVETGGAETGGAETGGAETGGAETGGAETGGDGTGGDGTGGSDLCADGPLEESLASCQPSEFVPSGDFHQDCVDRINQIRMECQCLPPLERWTEAEACADEMAAYDASVDEAHAGFRADVCTPGGWAQNECPGWGAPDEIILDSRWYEACLMMMWHEVDNPAGEQGHYVAMSSTRYTRVACGLYDSGDGNVWSVQNFQ